MNMHSLFGSASTLDLMNTGAKGRPMIVDSFAGGGGASTGIEMALGRSPDIAINHNPAALALHAANHPETLHLSENVYHVDPLDHMRGRHIGLMHFSPDCKHFSKAKGGKPVERNIRDLAWIIPGWIERIQKSGGRVDVVTMENVEEWKDWGPLIETERGLMPCPDRRGQTFQAWCKAIRKLGGRIEWRELRACDYGAPTIRKRLFLVIRFDGKKIVWPEPTHGAPDDPDVIAGKKLPWRVAAEIIDWSLPCPSIFDTAAEIWSKHGLRAVRPLAGNTMARVARGMKRYVLDADRPFIVNLTHGWREEDAGQPFRTITGANRSEKAVISPSITRFNSGATGSAMDEPMPTVTANSYIKRPGGAAPLGVVAPILAELGHAETSKNGAKRWGFGSKPVNEVLGTVTAGGKSHALVAPHLMTMRNSGKPFNGADEPTHTITAGGAGLSVVAPHLTAYYGPGAGGEDRSADPEKPLNTVTTENRHAVVVPTLVGCGGRAGQSRPRGGDEPLATVTTKADGCVAAAFVARQFGASVGHAVDEPSATVTAGVNKSQLVAPYLQKYFGTGDGAREDGPCHTVTTKDRFGHVEAAIDAPPFTPDQEERAREVAAFLRAHGFWDERDFVTLDIGGQTFVVVDIGMRMLTPRELFNAQGFPPDYVIDGAWEGEGEDRRFVEFPKNVQVSCCGNSVSPPPYAAIVAANCPELMVQQEAAE